MADSIISVVLEQLASYVQEEVELVVGFRKQVLKLTATLKLIQGVVADAERKQVRDDSVKVWLEELKNIFYAADDVLDEWHTKAVMDQGQLQENTHRSEKVLSYLFSLCFCCKHVCVRYDIGHQIQDISKDLDALAQQRLQFGLNVIETDVLSSEWQARPLTSSFINSSKIYGREHDKEIIISKLLGGSSHQENGMLVVSIVGMGGFGKTALAQIVFNDDTVQNNFENKMWVCVSEPFDLIRVSRAIIEQANGKAPNVNEWQAWHKHLCDSIKGKKFLLVLDDVWTRNSDDWEPLKLSLDGGALGSRIMVTTRNLDVAKMIGSSYTHDISKLSDEDSWLLLRDIALSGRQGVAENFETVGKKIAMKCKGVPLAVKTLAGHLCFQNTKQQWNHVLKSDLWGVDEIEQKFLPSFLLSYHSLPSNIKQCFIYCAIFPKDALLIKDDLVKLWMAQGFLGSDGIKELEKVGEDYFDHLAMCSFFQDFKEEDGYIIKCKMHDLVHDFAQFLAKKECSYLEMNNMEFDVNKIRHICTSSVDDSVIYKAKNLRTLLFKSYSTMPDLLFDKLTCLRTLDLGSTTHKELAKEVGMLLHLRYLRLKSRDLLELPETICKLYNLQSLILNGCSSLCKLPNGIGNLKNLRHLDIEETRALSYMPSGIGRLSLLRTLSKFIVGGSSSSDLEECKISDLKSLNNLGGCLNIKGLEQVSDVNEATEAELKKKKNIRKLRLEFGEDVEESGMEKGVLERLEPHENLEHLIVWNYQDSHFPSWMENTSMLTNLIELDLYECKKCKELPALDKLESLQKLRVDGLSSVKYIKYEFLTMSHNNNNNGAIFPKLRELGFWSMWEWEEWSIPFERDGVIFPRLKHLTLRICPKLKVLLDFRKFKSLETLELSELGMWEGSDTNMIVPTKEEEEEEDKDGCSVCYLKKLWIQDCSKLKVIPHCLFPHTLRKLWIWKCPELKGGMQPCLPPLLEKLDLSGDTGAFPESLQQCSLSLLDLRMTMWPHSSVPQGFNQLKVVQRLEFSWCETLDLELKELKHFTSLRWLFIRECPILEQCFQSSAGDEWRSILSHVTYININGRTITD